MAQSIVLLERARHAAFLLHMSARGRDQSVNLGWKYKPRQRTRGIRAELAVRLMALACTKERTAQSNSWFSDREPGLYLSLARPLKNFYFILARSSTLSDGAV
jgi:hypothetical protein